MPILLLVLLGISYGQDACDIYMCEDGIYNLKDNQCAFVFSDGFAVKPCENETFPYCPLTKIPGEIVQCEPVVATLVNAYPGEICKASNRLYNIECAAGSRCICESDVCRCVGQKPGDTCEVNEACNPGLWCDSNICVFQYSKGDSCTQDYQCKNNYTCANGKCAHYRTLPEGENCTSDEQCESYNCYDLMDEKVCYETPKSKNSVPVVCTYGTDCISTQFGPDDQYASTSTCECGRNSSGNRYCGLFPGDKDYAALISLQKKWYDGGLISQCNTARRSSDWCLYSLLSTAEYEVYKYYMSTVANFAWYVQIEDCVKNTLFPEYGKEQDAADEYEERDDDDNLSGFVAALGMVILI